MNATLRTYALREAERLAMTEALNAMIQLAEVRERALSESDEARTDLHSQVMAAEKSSDEWQDKRDELARALEEHVKESDAATVKQDARERRILAALDSVISFLPPDSQLRRDAQEIRNAALAEEIQF